MSHVHTRTRECHQISRMHSVAWQAWPFALWTRSHSRVTHMCASVQMPTKPPDLSHVHVAMWLPPPRMPSALTYPPPPRNAQRRLAGLALWTRSHSRCHDCGGGAACPSHPICGAGCRALARATDANDYFGIVSTMLGSVTPLLIVRLTRAQHTR